MEPPDGPVVVDELPSNNLSRTSMLRHGSCIVSAVGLEDTGWRRFTKADGFCMPKEGSDKSEISEACLGSDARKGSKVRKKKRRKQKGLQQVHEEHADGLAEAQHTQAAVELAGRALAACLWQQDNDEEGDAIAASECAHGGKARGVAGFAALLSASSARLKGPGNAAVSSLIAATQCMFSAASRPLEVANLDSQLEGALQLPSSEATGSDVVQWKHEAMANCVETSNGEVCPHHPLVHDAEPDGVAHEGWALPLRERSTGLMQAIPPPRGKHMRFDLDHNEDMESDQLTDTALEDIVQHTVGLAVPTDIEPSETTQECGMEPEDASAAVSEPWHAAINGTAAVGNREHGVAARAALAVAAGQQTSPPRIASTIAMRDGTCGGHLQSNAQDDAALAPALMAYQQALTERYGGPGLFQRLKAAKLGKYWMQRYSLWSRFDEGVLMDEEGWYSATPEVLARHHADAESTELHTERMACDVAVDAFCGVGGNAVQLAATCKRVIAVDISLERLQLAQHNAAVYGVADRIDFLCADFLKMAPHLQADTVFLSPPWGGPGYSLGSKGGSSFDVEQGLGSLGVGFAELLSMACSALAKPSTHLAESNNSSGRLQQCASGVACFLPRNSSLEQLSAALPDGSLCEVEQNFLNNAFKSVTVYYGQLAHVA